MDCVGSSRWRLVREKGCCNSKKKGARAASTNKGKRDCGVGCENKKKERKRREKGGERRE